MPDAHYTEARLAAVYDVECGWSEDRDFYLALAGDDPIDILDLGCGTGLLARAYAERGHRVVGADPAPAMLAIARAGASGDRVDWIEAAAQKLDCDRSFDLVVMTGHAFQVLLEPDDVRSCLATVRRRIKPSGRFVFETRNPAIDWATRWTHERHFDTPFGPLRVVRRIDWQTGARIGFTTGYDFRDGHLDSASVLRFWSRRDILRFASVSALGVADCRGDWRGGAFDPRLSEEMIFTLVAA